MLGMLKNLAVDPRDTNVDLFYFIWNVIQRTTGILAETALVIVSSCTVESCQTPGCVRGAVAYSVMEHNWNMRSKVFFSIFEVLFIIGVESFSCRQVMNLWRFGQYTYIIFEIFITRNIVLSS